MKTNKKFSAFVALFVGLAFFTFSTTAQNRKTTNREATANGGIRASAQKVSIQIKNVSKFIYVLGSVATGIEDIDKDSKAGKISRSVAAQNEENKQKVIQTIRNLRAGLAALEVEFRAKPALRNYLFQIQGITDIASNAEDEAASGQFIQSGKTLLLIIEKLSDTLVVMP